MRRMASGWKITLLLFFITSVVESFGYSHIASFLPLYLQGMRVSHAATWVGVLSAITFIVGLPLVPLWGVWATRYGGKSVIIRSAYVEAVVFAILGFSHALPGVIAAMAMVGFQLGNTGIMLAAIRGLVPNDQVGTAVSTFSVASPIGMALGPLIGGWLVQIGMLTLHSLYLMDSLLSIATGTMLLSLYREALLPENTVSPQPRQSVWSAAWQSVHVTFSLTITWVLFGVYLLLMIARQMVNPYVPLGIEHLYHAHGNLTVVVGGIIGISALVGAVVTIVAGRLGDKVGFTRVLALAFALMVPATLLLGFVGHLLSFMAVLTVFSAMASISGAMIFALFSTRIPPSHRSTALNLVYLPLYVGGIIGPLMASGLIRFGVVGPFCGAATVGALGLVAILYGGLHKGYLLSSHAENSIAPGKGA